MLVPCTLKKDDKDVYRWNGKIHKVTACGTHYVVLITTKFKKFEFVFCEIPQGFIVSIPDMQKCALITSDLTDREGNFEKLLEVYNNIDSCTISNVLYLISPRLKCIDCEHERILMEKEKGQIN